MESRRSPWGDFCTARLRVIATYHPFYNIFPGDKVR